MLEGIVQSAAWLAPEGAHTDLALEATSAALGVVNIANERLVQPTHDRGAGSSTLSTCIAIIHQLEVVLEMGAERALGPDDKWSLLVVVEALKASLRLAILRRSGGRVLLGDADGSAGPVPPWVASFASPSERAARTLRALAAFRASRTSVAGYPACAPLPRVPQSTGLPPQLQRARATLVAGEAVRILRPVVYCLAVRRYGRRSWTPWALALSMDMASDALLQRVPALNGEEREELHLRRVLLVYYLLFSPAYEAGIQQGMRGCERALARVPLLGSLAERMRDTLDGVATFHTYTTSL